MSVFAGIWVCSDDSPPDSASIASLLGALGRSGDEPTTYSDDRLFVAKINVGAIDELGLLKSANGVVSALAGEPFFEADASTQRTREQDLRSIAEGLTAGSLETLAKCRGSFALANYVPSESSLLLATDTLGVRPLYYHAGSRYLVFSTALHVLEAMDCVPKILDPVGVFEAVGFGYPLSDRSPYIDVKILRSAEALCFKNGEHQIRTYFAWDEIPVSEKDLGTLADECYEQFMGAVSLRARHPHPVSFLSGGLDSRAIVGALVALGKPVIGVNVVRKGKLDTLLAERFATAIGCELIKVESPPEELQPTSMWKAAGRADWSSDEHMSSPNPWFSGDGGSVGLGHEYIYTEHVEKIRRGDLESFCRYALDQRGLPFEWFYRNDVFEALRKLVEHDIRNDLERMSNAEPGRRFHLWLMDNDQRRHLHAHAEGIDQSRTEYLTPFYDTEFMKSVITVPVDRCLLHEFYYEWMKRLPEAVSSAPWQAYPGHLPCPIPLGLSDDQIRNQWDPDPRGDWDRVRPFAARARRIVLGPTFPAPYLRRHRVLAGLGLHTLHLKSVVGGFMMVNTYADFMQKCKGQVSPIPQL